MSGWDDELRRELARQQPPAGFTNRVMARVQQASVPRRRLPWQQWQWAAACIVVCLLAGSARWETQRRERVRQETARSQLLQALQVTTATLHRVQKKIQELN